MAVHIPVAGRGMAVAEGQSPAAASGIEVEDFDFEISCGPVPPVPGESPHFALDPEVKEERGYLIEGKRRHLVLERKDRTAFLREHHEDDCDSVRPFIANAVTSQNEQARNWPSSPASPSSVVDVEYRDSRPPRSSSARTASIVWVTRSSSAGRK